MPLMQRHSSITDFFLSIADSIGIQAGITKTEKHTMIYLVFRFVDYILICNCFTFQL